MPFSNEIYNIDDVSLSAEITKFYLNLPQTIRAYLHR